MNSSKGILPFQDIAQGHAVVNPIADQIMQMAIFQVALETQSLEILA